MSSTALFIILMSLFGRIQGLDPADDGLTITSITLDSTINVCFKVDPDNAPMNTVFILTIGEVKNPSSENDYDMVASGYAPPADAKTETCVDFTGAFVESKDTAIFFALEGAVTANDNKKVTHVAGMEYITLSEIPKGVKAQWVGKTGLKKHGNTLRINANLEGWKICGNKVPDTNELQCKGGVGSKHCYAINMGSEIDDATLTVCSLTNTNSVPVIVTSIAIDIVDGTAPVPETITLNYKPTSKLLITSDASEVLVYNEELSIICGSATECDINSYVPAGNKKLNIIFIITINNKATGSTENEFQDSNLQIYQFDNTVFEAKWTKNMGDTYFVERTAGTSEGGDSFLSANVNCTNTNDFCNAYFVNVPNAEGGANYNVTTKPKNGADTNDLNAIQSKISMTWTAPLPRVVDNALGNIRIEKQYKKDSGNMELNICFGPDSTKGLNNTQVEVVLISANRQWRRVLEESMRQVEQDSCYSTTFLLKSDRDSYSLLTALVIQRDVNSNEVLSFHRSDLNLSAPKAIKPEMDNSSEGYTRILAIVGAAIGGVACMVALAAAAVLFVMKRNRNNDGLQYPLHRTSIENSDIVHGLENPYSTM